MSKVKVLHLADSHFERKITHLSYEKAKIRRSETLLTFKRVLEQFCDAQIVLISGDMFDGDCTDGTVEFLAEVFEQHREKHFFISCGNHDCCESIAIKKLSMQIPDNVKIFGEVIEKVFIKEFGVCVYGISFSAQNSYTSLLNKFNVDDKNAINIMTMHGDIALDSRYNPISINEIADSGLEYLALGHVHKFSGFMTSGVTTYAYPGVLEPCGFDETGECGVIYGEISKNEVCMDFYPVSRRKYHSVDFDITGFKSNEQLVSTLCDLIINDDLYKINLLGERCGFIPDIESYKEIINSFWLELYDFTSNSDSILDYCDEVSLRGKTAQHLKLLENKYDEKTYLQACEIITNMMCR